MVELTIDDLLRWKPVEMDLVGDERSRNAAVAAEFSWAVCIRSTTPVLPPLRGSEIVIVPQAVLAELEQTESITWPEVVEHLRSLPIAGVITDQPRLGQGVDDLIVIEVASTDGTALEVRLNREFTERRGSLYQLGSELARSFSSASIGGSDLNRFLQVASQRTGVPVALIAPTGRVLAASADGLQVPPALASTDVAGQRVHAAGLDWISQEISGAGLPEGVFLGAGVRSGEPGDRARLVLEQTAEALGWMFDRLPPVAAVSPEEEAGEILTEFAATGVLPAAARRRLDRAAQDIDLDGRLRLLAEVDDAPDVALRFEADGFPIALIGDAAYDTRFSGRFERYVASPPFEGIEHLPGAIRPVVKALRLRQSRQLPAGRLDLGVPGSGGAAGMLLALEAAPDGHAGHFDGYARAMLGALEKYDEARGMDLIATLDAYLAAGASVAEASARLGVHRNTLAYRLARIVDVSGHDLADPGTRFDLQLAIILRQLGKA